MANMNITYNYRRRKIITKTNKTKHIQDVSKAAKTIK